MPRLLRARRHGLPARGGHGGVRRRRARALKGGYWPRSCRAGTLHRAMRDAAAGARVRQLKEIKNGRLAMLAFGGIFHQQLLTKSGTLAYLAHP